jgi:hypothetical protein
VQEQQQLTNVLSTTNNMKATTLASLFLLACLMVVSALAADGPTAGSTDDDVQTLFRSINGNGGSTHSPLPPLWLA